MPDQTRSGPAMPPPHSPASDLPGEAPRSALRGMAGGRGDNIDLLKALFLGLLVTALFYEVFPLPFIDQGRILALFDNRISEVITGMALWSLFILLFKYLKYRQQLKGNLAFGQHQIQATLAEGVYARNAEEMLATIKKAMAASRLKHYEQSVVFRRVSQVLLFIRSVPKKETVNDLLEYQSQIDLKKLESSYTTLQVFIWAIPILGFIGTVFGIGESVNNFSLFIQTAETGAQFSSQMRNALGGVTSGLAVAFNTTFLALVLVIPVMIVTSFLQKSEESLLLAVEEYCLEELLPHLRITPSSDAVTENFDEHLHKLMGLSNTWLNQLEPLVEKLSHQTAMVSHQIGGIQPLVKEFTDRLLPGESESGKGENAEPAPAGEAQPPAKPAPAGSVAAKPAPVKRTAAKRATAKVSAAKPAPAKPAATPGAKRGPARGSGTGE